MRRVPPSPGPGSGGPLPGGPEAPGGPEPGPGPDDTREAARIALAGLLLYPLLVWGFASRTPLGIVDALYLAGLVELLPILALAQLPLVGRAEIDRLEAYLGSAVVLSVVGTGAVLAGWEGPGPVAMGIAHFDGAGLVQWTLFLLGAVAALQVVILLLGRWIPLSESPLVEELLPVSLAERVAWVGVSFVAGFAEELAFRGFAIPSLAPILGGSWAAVAFTSVVFGLLHAYQGAVGIVRTALFGGVVGAVFVHTGTLWPAIAAHVTFDLVVGLWLGRRILEASKARTRE